MATPVGMWWARNVVLATGWSDLPLVPKLADDLPRHVHQLTAHEYRNPGSVAEGGVLVVGASATGIQLADELLAAGREVTIAVGRHRRMPRMYRGRDIFWWLMRIGLLDTAIDEVADANEAPFEPSLQVSRPTVAPWTWPTSRRGEHGWSVGMAADGERVHLAPGLPETLRDADARLERCCGTSTATSTLLAFTLDPSLQPACRSRCRSPARRSTRPGLGIRTMLWAIGHRRAYPWLRLPVLDERGEIRQRHGITPVPGLFVLATGFSPTGARAGMRRRPRRGGDYRPHRGRGSASSPAWSPGGTS